MIDVVFSYVWAFLDHKDRRQFFSRVVLRALTFRHRDAFEGGPEIRRQERREPTQAISISGSDTACEPANAPQRFTGGPGAACCTVRGDGTAVGCERGRRPLADLSWRINRGLAEHC